MAMSISGSVFNGLGSSFLISRGKRSGVGLGVVAMRVGRKNVITSPKCKKSWVPTAVKGDASDYVKEKGSEVGHASAQKGQDVNDHVDRAKYYMFEKASEAIDNVAEIAQFASEFVTEKGKETKKETASISEKAKEFIVEKAGEIIDIATDVSKKTAKYVGDKAKEVKEAIMPPKT
ncbi:unnamed protein product [Arabidopsis thaliana]|uniref:(thale cress) hypothetical protein n=1 Tax=Arabidopsis thaliana TaxID=3702 RepID=A0A7G2E8V5_ARATH|nr:unnamed protein product [Arabidopsis thaliana]